jgi:hypothetical protein
MKRRGFESTARVASRILLVEVVNRIWSFSSPLLQDHVGRRQVRASRHEQIPPGQNAFEKADGVGWAGGWHGGIQSSSWLASSLSLALALSLVIRTTLQCIASFAASLSLDDRKRDVVSNPTRQWVQNGSFSRWNERAYSNCKHSQRNGGDDILVDENAALGRQKN